MSDLSVIDTNRKGFGGGGFVHKYEGGLKPLGKRIIVKNMHFGEQKTKGGIIMTKETVDRESLATVVAYVVKMGPLCYSEQGKYGEPWCKEGQWVLIGRYAGARFKLEDGAEVRIINDDEIIATILNPDDIVSL